MQWLICFIFITLQWDAITDPSILRVNIYARASTEKVFKQITSATAPKNYIDVWVDGRRNWYFYATATNGRVESLPSNIVYRDRGY